MIAGDAEGDRLEQRLAGRLEVRRQEHGDGQDDADDDAGEGHAGHDPGRDDGQRDVDDRPRGEARGVQQGAGHEDGAQPEARRQAAMSSIVGISAAADSPDDRATSEGLPPSASMRRGRNVKPLMIPMCRSAAASEHEPEPRRDPQRDPARAEAQPEPAGVRVGSAVTRAPRSRRSPRWRARSARAVSGTKAAATAMTRAAGHEQHEGRLVAGPVVHEARPRSPPPRSPGW